jgi:hypothetical protein
MRYRYLDKGDVLEFVMRCTARRIRRMDSESKDYRAGMGVDVLKGIFM